ncbi:MAG: extracellular solute-binding protein [Phycisphaerales bacterium]|nr:MAG: extracellular solute-binding protein [Phycisphaerales bacterium]
MCVSHGKPRLLWCAVVLLACLPFLNGCGEKGEEVIVYISADEYVAREVVRAFEDETGIRVRFVGDTEAQKTTGLVERLRAERDNPQADAFWSSEVFLTIALADEGVLTPYESPIAIDWPETFRDANSYWYGLAARGRVIVYAPDRVPEAHRPRTWQDLTNERFRGRIVMADPRFGTTGGHFAAKKVFWGDEVYTEFLHGLAANETRLLASGNAGVVRAVADGEADVGMTDTDDVWAAQAQGLNVELIFPDHAEGDERSTGIGTLLIPNTVAIVAGGPKPENAAAFVDFMLAGQAERILAETVSGNTPVRPGLAAEYPDSDIPDPLAVDFHEVAAAFEDAVSQAMRILRDGEER